MSEYVWLLLQNGSAKLIFLQRTKNLLSERLEVQKEDHPIIRIPIITSQGPLTCQEQKRKKLAGVQDK